MQAPGWLSRFVFPSIYLPGSSDRSSSQQDAYVLAALLNREGTQRKDLARAAAVYDAIRRPFSQHVAKLSAENGRLYTLNHPDIVFDEISGANGHSIVRADDPRLQKTFAWVRNNWTWAWDTTIDRDVERALAMFSSRA